MRYFMLIGESDAQLRLKSFGSSSRGEKSTIRIELETTDPYELGHALRSLSEVQKAQRAPKAPASPKRKKPVPLALPAPHAALPSPGEGTDQ